MGRYVKGESREQIVLFPERLEDWVAKDSMVGVMAVFVEALDLGKLGFERAEASATGRPGYHPAMLLKIYISGYLKRVQSSRRLETAAASLTKCTRLFSSKRLSVGCAIALGMTVESTIAHSTLAFAHDHCARAASIVACSSVSTPASPMSFLQRVRLDASSGASDCR